jgi:hypothetical protein
MKTGALCLFTIVATALACTASPGPAAATTVSSTVTVANPNAQYALSIGRPAAAQAEAASDGFFAPGEAVAKARTQVERELALLGNTSSTSAGSSLIVPRKETDPKALAETEEDLAVMSHLLDKAAVSKDDKATHAMGITVHNFRSGSIPRTIYLEGYGALFFLNVNYPLVAPPAKKDDSQTKEETNTEWENARRELFQPSSFSPDMKFYSFDTDGAFAFSSNGAVEEYNADKVEDLKNNLIAALKNAAHIRKLGNDETVTVIVSGRSAVADPKGTARKASSSTTRGSNVWTTRLNSPDPRGTRLIVRAKKSDIEAFQKQKTSADDFRKQVTIMTY